jgi:hypothetical protein
MIQLKQDFNIYICVQTISDIMKNMVSNMSDEDIIRGMRNREFMS